MMFPNKKDMFVFPKENKKTESLKIETKEHKKKKKKKLTWTATPPKLAPSLAQPDRTPAAR